MENSKLRVIHKSLIFDAVKEGEETYLFRGPDSSGEEIQEERELGQTDAGLVVLKAGLLQ